MTNRIQRRTTLASLTEIVTRRIANRTLAKRLRPRLAVSLVVFLLVPLPSATKAQTPAVVLAPGSTNYGKTYPEWLASWAQWASSLETIHHPLYDTADLSAGQSGAVWFLGRHWGRAKHAPA